MIKRIELPERPVFIIYALLSVVGMGVLFFSFIGYRAEAWGRLPVIASFIPLLIAVALFVNLLLKWKECPERVFLIVAIPILCGFAFFFLPDHIPDEIWHIYRVFSIENPGSAMVVPNSMDQKLLPTTYAALYDAMTSNISWSDSFVVPRDMSTYLAHLYLVPGGVAALCELFGVNPFITVFIARLVNAALYVIGGYWIIKILPLAKVCACVYLLNPLLIQQEASCSADAVTNTLALLFIALILKARFSESISRNMVIGLAATFIFVSLSKFFYALLAYLLLLLVPKCKSRKTRIAIYAITGGVTLLAALLVIVVINVPSYQSAIDLIRNPPELAWVLWNTFSYAAPGWIDQFVGLYLGNLDIAIWKPCGIAYLCILILSLIFNFGESFELARFEKIGIAIFVAILSVALILVFRSWSVEVDNRSDLILGVQGRYFIPFAELILFCCSSPRAAQVRKNSLLVYSAILTIIYAIDLVTISYFFS